MIRPLTASVNDQGYLMVGGVSTIDLVEKYGSPLYVMDAETIRAIVQAYLSIRSEYPNSRIAYASKALSLTAIYQLLSAYDLDYDVVSDGEFYTVQQAGIENTRIFFHGNNKSDEELTYALEQQTGRIVIDNLDEVYRLVQTYQQLKLKKPQKVIVRINPEIEAHTHEFIQTGQRDSKFGVLKEDLKTVIKEIQSSGVLECVGLHAHIGSQIFDVEPFSALVDTMLFIAEKLIAETGAPLMEFNIGGGIGIPYTSDDDPPDIAHFARSIGKRFALLVKQHQYPDHPWLVLEPGRSIVANAGITLYRVGAVKTIPGVRTYVSVDGGMADNPRPIIYSAKYSADCANRMKDKKTLTATIAGKFCESGDILIQDVNLPPVQRGDCLVVYGTGAYNYSMSSNYNRYRKPAMVLVDEGKEQLILKRETLKDLTRNDVRL